MSIWEVRRILNLKQWRGRCQLDILTDRLYFPVKTVPILNLNLLHNQTFFGWEFNSSYTWMFNYFRYITFTPVELYESLFHFIILSVHKFPEVKTVFRIYILTLYFFIIFLRIVLTPWIVWISGFPWVCDLHVSQVTNSSSVIYDTFVKDVEGL